MRPGFVMLDRKRHSCDGTGQDKPEQKMRQRDEGSPEFDPDDIARQVHIL